MPIQILRAAIHKEKEFYVAECIESGTVSRGSSREEAYKNLKEATELYIKEFPKLDFPIGKNLEEQNMKPGFIRALMMVDLR